MPGKVSLFSYTQIDYHHLPSSNCCNLIATCVVAIEPFDARAGDGATGAWALPCLLAQPKPATKQRQQDQGASLRESVGFRSRKADQSHKTGWFLVPSSEWMFWAPQTFQLSTSNQPRLFGLICLTLGRRGHLMRPPRSPGLSVCWEDPQIESTTTTFQY